MALKGLSVRQELQGDAINAVPPVGRRGAIIENVAEMAAAPAAVHLSAAHPEATVFRGV